MIDHAIPHQKWREIDQCIRLQHWHLTKYSYKDLSYQPDL